jgi:plastocyanin
MHWGVKSTLGGSLVVILAACSGAPPSTAPTAPNGASPAPSSIPTAPPSASPAPEFSSSTTSATAAPDGAVTVELAGPPGQFVPRMVTANAGDVVFFLSNTSQGVHSMAIDRVAVTFDGDRVTNVPVAESTFVRHGTSSIFAVDGLPAGTYFFWCAVDNHASEGMTGTLIVSP